MKAPNPFVTLVNACLVDGSWLRMETLEGAEPLLLNLFERLCFGSPGSKYAIGAKWMPHQKILASKTTAIPGSR